VCDAGLYNFFLIDRKYSPALFVPGVLAQLIALLFKPGLPAYFPFPLFILHQRTFLWAEMKNKD
jgi:hypothetical protein